VPVQISPRWSPRDLFWRFVAHFASLAPRRLAKGAGIGMG
jgi:hypothetical protein